MSGAFAGEPAYSDAGSGRRARACWSDGRVVQIEVGRARAYPGLAGESPDTRAYYAFACDAFDGARRVLDAGCGAGRGARMLAERFEAVVAVDRDDRAVEFTRVYAPRAEALRADVADVLAEEPFDAAVVVDVLGHARDPRALLRAVRARLLRGASIVVAEPRAYPAQLLRAPARRAFSPRALEALLAATGFDVDAPIGEAGPFCGYRAHAVDDPACAALDEAARATDAGDAARAISALTRAAESERGLVRVEALVALGDVRLACRDGDGAARAYLAARVVAPEDARPPVGLARLSLASDERHDARELALAARALDPTCVPALCALALVEEDANELGGEECARAICTGAECATALLRAANALAPDDVELAMAYASRLGAQPAAVHALERARGYGDPLPAAFHVLLAELLAASGRRADAAHEARFAEALSPSSSPA